MLGDVIDLLGERGARRLVYSASSSSTVVISRALAAISMNLLLEAWSVSQATTSCAARAA